MRLGNLKVALLIIILFSLKIENLNSQEKINLQELQPTFEEEIDLKENNGNQEITIIKSKQKKSLDTNQTIVKLKALDKITARTSNIDIEIGKKQRFGYLEIIAKKCKRSAKKENQGVVAYIQVKDLSEKKDNKVFVFNGWTFSSSPTLKTFDHPVYDLWVTGCENI